MKNILLFFTILFLTVPCFASEQECLNTSKPVQSVQYVFHIDDDEPNIETTYQAPNIEDEIKLKGSVIFNENINPIKEIELDKDIVKPHINLKTSNMIIPVKIDNIKTSGIYMLDRSAISNASRLSGEEYMIEPVFSYITERTGNFSYGTFYSSVIDSCQLQSTLNLYTRYDFKHFAITGAVGTNDTNMEGTRDKRTIEFSPEIKISKSFVIRDTVRAYVNETYRKNKISIIYTPQWRNQDILRFELGLTHTFYSGGKVNSAIEFSTRIRL